MLQKKIPEFHWRFAQPEEQQQLLNQMQTPMTPLIYLGSKTIIGIPKAEKLYALIQEQRLSQKRRFNTQ